MANNPALSYIQNSYSDFLFEREELMATIDLSELTDIDGFKAGALVDSDSGLALATEGGGLDLELAAAGNTEVLNAKRRVGNSLGINDEIEDILISRGNSYHLIRPLTRNTKLFIYLVLDRQRSNLAMARHQLRSFEKNLDFS